MGNKTSNSQCNYDLDLARDVALAREFIDAPIGHHSLNLQRLLRAMRSGPVKGKFALLMTKPGREWTLIRCSGQVDVLPTIYWDSIFFSIEDAEREVFRLRWKELTGLELDLPA